MHKKKKKIIIINLSKKKNVKNNSGITETKKATPGSLMVSKLD